MRATLGIDNNEVILETQIEGQVSAIDFLFKGNIDAEVLIGGEWEFRLVGKTLTFINMRNVELNAIQPLLKYSGMLNIIGGKVSCIIANEVVNVNLDIQNLYDYMIDEDYSTVNLITDKIEDLGLTKSQKKEIKASITEDRVVRNNILAPNNKLFFKDGTAYVGECHKHHNGQFMTGATHSRDSKKIYIKDKNRGLFDPDKKITIEEARNVYTRMLSHLRKATASSERGGY